jgi:hypothetical protein
MIVIISAVASFDDGRCFGVVSAVFPLSFLRDTLSVIKGKKTEQVQQLALKCYPSSTITKQLASLTGVLTVW